MKKLTQILMMGAMLFALIPTLSAQLTASADPVPAAPEEIKRTDAEVAQALNARLIEIKGIDKKGMSAIEKKKLRDELKAIKKELKANSGGIYLSLGGILLVVLLLILLL